MTYQQYTDEQDESYRAVYDMGCKLHTLLLTNSCLNPEVEAFKKLNMVARYPSNGLNTIQFGRCHAL